MLHPFMRSLAARGRARVFAFGGSEASGTPQSAAAPYDDDGEGEAEEGCEGAEHAHGPAEARAEPREPEWLVDAAATLAAAR